MSQKRLLSVALLIIGLAGLGRALGLHSSSDQIEIASAGRNPDQSSSEPLSAAEIRKIRADFSKVEREQIQELENVQKKNEKDSRAARRQRLSDWESEERTARRQFFQSNRGGPARRDYIRDFVARRKALQSALKAEEKQEKQENRVRLQSLRQDLESRRQELEKHLTEKRRPPETLLKP